MSWRDGCAPLPTVDDGATPVRFDFGAADAAGQRLDGLRRSIDVDVDARARSTALLVDWAGRHREAYDRQRSTQEAVMGGAGLDAELSRLRAAWDEAAAAQARANRTASEATEAPPASSPVPR